MFVKKFVFVLILVLGTQEMSARPPPYTREKMERFLDTLQDQFETRYAPYDWKVAEHGWNFPAEVALAKEALWMKPHLTIKDFQMIVRDLVHTTKDYHVGVLFYHTEMATLPFTVKKFEGAYYVTSTDSGAYPLNVGDELLTMNGRDIDEEIGVVLQQITSSNPMTDHAFAEIFLTARRGNLGMEIPQGGALMEFRKRDTNEVRTRTFRWRYFSQTIQDPPYVLKAFGKKEVSQTDSDDLADAKRGLPKMLWRSELKQQMLSPYFVYMKAADDFHGRSPPSQAHPNEIGRVQNFLPNLGEVIWRGSYQYFNAYIFLDKEGRKIGYVRIPLYDAGSDGTEEFAKIIKKMERETDGLVIDQLNNPGGSAFYMYSLLTFLTEKPMETPLHRLTITQRDVENAQETLGFVAEVEHYFDILPEKESLLDGYPVTRENIGLMKEYCHFIMDEWAMGHYLTQPTHLWAIREVLPNPQITYTKPILVLVNELCISCGDFFPSILQDNGRAKIMGVRTAGAGGAIVGFELDNPFGIKAIHLTASIAERPDGKKIENLGVTPDIEYRLSAEDFHMNYAPFIAEILEQVDEMLKEKQENIEK